MTRTADVIIIGAGVIGCSIAYHLAKMGCRNVVVLEKDSIGSGSTGKCAGGIRQQFSTEINIQLSMESVKFFRTFEQETGHPADLRQNGYLMLATTEEELEAFQRSVILQRKLGLEVYLLSPGEAKEIVPPLNIQDVLGATYCPSDGYADPYSVVQGFASAAKTLGVKIYEDTEVIGLRQKERRVQGVLTASGEFTAPVLVDAAGPFAAHIGRMVDVDVPVHPHRRHIFATTHLDEIKKDSPMVVDFHSGFWFRREGHGLIFGMRNPDEPESFDTSVDWSFLPSIARVASRRLPLLENTGVATGQAGLHEDTPDANAIVGQAPEVEGLYLACGFSGHGFMHSPAIGRLIAKLILTGNGAPDLSPLAPHRFRMQVCNDETCFI
jgi:sarcosine oxidase subunit beta